VILKVAHHGSATASTPAFLGAVQPKVAIVSSGAGNPYGHPAKSTIDRLKGTGAQVLRTDTDGSVQVSIDPAGEISVSISGARRVTTTPFAAVALAQVAPARPTILAPATSAFACGIPSGG